MYKHLANLACHICGWGVVVFAFGFLAPSAKASFIYSYESLPGTAEADVSLSCGASSETAAEASDTQLEPSSNPFDHLLTIFPSQSTGSGSGAGSVPPEELRHSMPATLPTADASPVRGESSLPEVGQSRIPSAPTVDLLRPPQAQPDYL